MTTTTRAAERARHHRGASSRRPASCWPGRGELSLRAVAARMGMTAPALYRYVASYQDLVRIVAFEIDKARRRDRRGRATSCPRTTRRPAGRLDDRVPDVGAGATAGVHPGLRQPRRRAASRSSTPSPAGMIFSELLSQLWAEVPVPDPGARRPRSRPRRDPARPGGPGRPDRRTRRAAAAWSGCSSGAGRALRHRHPRGLRPHRPADRRAGAPVPGDDRRPGRAARPRPTSSRGCRR